MDETDETQPTTADSANTSFPGGDADVPDASDASDAPGADGGPVANRLTGLAMKHRGSVAVWFVLPLITLGIYHLVWYYKIHKEMRHFDQRHALSPMGSVLVLIFLSWTVIAPLISYYNTGKAIANAQRAAGLPETCSPVACLLLTFVFGLNTWYMQHELNRVVDAYPGVAPGAEVALAA